MSSEQWMRLEYTGTDSWPGQHILSFVRKQDVQRVMVRRFKASAPQHPVSVPERWSVYLKDSDGDHCIGEFCAQDEAVKVAEGLMSCIYSTTAQSATEGDPD